MAENKQTY